MVWCGSTAWEGDYARLGREETERPMEAAPLLMLMIERPEQPPRSLRS